MNFASSIYVSGYNSLSFIYLVGSGTKMLTAIEYSSCSRQYGDYSSGLICFKWESQHPAICLHRETMRLHTVTQRYYRSSNPTKLNQEIILPALFRPIKLAKFNG